MSDFTDYGAKIEPLICSYCGEEIRDEEISCDLCVVDLHLQCDDAHRDKEHDG